MKPLTWGIGLLVLAALAIMPFFVTSYIVSFTIQTFMWVALAGSWNLISGFTGYVSFGHVAFFGTGAYTGALLISKAGWPWLPAGLAGSVTAAALALLIGYPCLRLKGPYFAIAMLGLNEVVRALISYFEDFTGGGSGISLPPILSIEPVYYAMGLSAVSVTLLTYVIITSQFGLRLLSIREDEIAAEAMGINTARLKLYAFLLSAVFPGIVGGFYAWYASHIEPLGTFPLLTTITMIIMCLFGGKGTVWGPVLGAVLLSVFQELVWARFLFVHQALFGALIVAVVLLLPKGILGVLQERYRLPRAI
ncbi:MAG: branched-chain amino acid ABC transporter permease [Deltaproteobacteria bacterium]|nr:branched-chain amino acid ABC transporter permease [Deltaproteobacteria bacterium]MBI3078354.1 branched-chain amino acid ABC transporter permease [Deltaproteobacteria bacterium]